MVVKERENDSCSGLGLDFFAHEPPIGPDHPLLALENVVAH